MAKIYCQCTMERKTKTGTERIVSYIPERFAVLDKVLMLKHEGKWTNGWVVLHVGHCQEGNPDVNKLIRGHRRNTGDSLPKNE